MPSLPRPFKHLPNAFGGFGDVNIFLEKKLPQYFFSEPERVGLFGMAEPSVELLFEFVGGKPPGAKIPQPASQPFVKAAQVFALQFLMGAKYALPQKRDSFFTRRNMCFAGVHSQAQVFGQIVFDAAAGVFEDFGIVSENNEVVHIADVVQTERLFDKMVERREVDIGKKLAGQIAHWQAFSALKDGEKVVVGEIFRHKFLRVGIVYDFENQVKCVLAGNFSGNEFFQNGMVYARKILLNVRFEYKAVLSQKLATPPDTPVRAFSAPVGERIGYECFFKNRLDDIANGMVYYPVAERSSRYQAGFRLKDFERPIRPRHIRPIGEFFLQQKQLALKMGFESGDIGLVALALFGKHESAVKVGEAGCF